MRLQNALRRGLDGSLQAFYALDARHTGPHTPAASGHQPCQMQGEVEERPTRRQERGLETWTWQQSDRCGYLCSAVNARSLRWHTRSANDWAARLAGLHREEYLARMASLDMPPSTSDLRLLCSNVACIVLVARQTCVQLQAAARGHGSWTRSGCGASSEPPAEQSKLYHFMSCTKRYARERDGEGVIVRSCLTVYRDEHGRVDKFTRTQVAVSAEEYDHVLQRTPEACEELAAAVVGRRKSGAELTSLQLLADESIACMTQSAAGLAQLDRLAALLEQQFAPILKLARQLQRAPDERPAFARDVPKRARRLCCS